MIMNGMRGRSPALRRASDMRDAVTCNVETFFNQHCLFIMASTPSEAGDEGKSSQSDQDPEIAGLQRRCWIAARCRQQAFSAVVVDVVSQHCH